MMILNSFFAAIWKRIVGFRQDCQGFVVMSTLAIFLFLFVLCASIYAVGETIHQRIKIQNACDAAAYSAAVVQADGLSRMAVVNRAMAWSYVQMTNRQMDYITYRWLKLTCKRFEEDEANAEDYAAQMTLCIDPQLGPWAILEALIAAVADRIFELDCSSGYGHERKVKDGRAWWCGLKYGRDRQISLNVNEGFMSAVQNSLTEQFLTFDRIKDATDAMGGVIDETSEKNEIVQSKKWGYWLGELIDHDKENIYCLNKTLERINVQMEISMKMTAENVLKAMLKDNRYDSESVLQDYYISIHIPHAENPYDAEKGNDSFFSPLHNTEADEMLFLNMQSANHAEKKLHQHFPVLLGGDSIAYGLDQWFIRGKGNYNKESGEKEYAFYSIDELSGVSLSGTKRNEGALGIQRVYKDANLNENSAGIFGNKNDRGNHLIDLTAIANWGLSRAASFFGTTASEITDESEDEGSTDDIIADYQNQIKQNKNVISDLEKENQKLNATKPSGYEDKIAENNSKIKTYKTTIKELESELDDFKSQIADGSKNLSDTTVSGSEGTVTADFKNEVLSFATSFGSSMLGKFAGNYVDITPSCVNTHAGTKNFMCSNVNQTTALYSEYRWASSKWYCCTTWKAYLYSVIFGAPPDKKHQYIYCDLVPHTFWEVPVTGKKLKARGWGHYAFFPKWFCGAEPQYPGNSYVSDGIGKTILEVLPPLTPETIKEKEKKHGYMKTPLDLSGLGIPTKCLQGDTTMPRDDYASCVVFPDGPFTFMEGKTSYAGFIQGHARIYADDKEIFDNRYVGAICKPWVLNERFFAGEGSIVVGAAMKHTNPFVQLFNFWNTQNNKNGTEEQEGNESTVLSAFNIPKGNFMWTMSAARAGVRHRRRNGAYDQERQYQITYDSTSDVENLNYSEKSGPYVKKPVENGWMPPLEEWDGSNDNKHALSRIYFPTQTQSPVWNGCPCGQNSQKFKNMWNLCETDWDATLLPLRYAGQRAQLYLEKEEDEDHVNENDAFNSQNYSTRKTLLDNHYEKIGNGKYWVWNNVATDKSAVLMSNPFINSRWKPANIPYGNDTGIPAAFLLHNRVQTGKEEKTINIFLKDKIL